MILKKKKVFITVEYALLGLIIAITIVLLINRKATPCDVDNSQVEISESMENVSSKLKLISEVESCGCGSNENETAKSQENSSEEISKYDIIKPSNFEVGEYVLLPTLPTNIKSYTDFRCYNLWYTPHYRLQQVSRTDENGLRRFNDDYIVAMGAFYSTRIGDRFEVTLDSGNTFTVILGDGKHPNDCDENNMYAPCYNYAGEFCANILEFIIDKDVMAKDVYSYGSIDCIDEFRGDIVKMKYLGRDTSADWDTYEVR